jgi:hypothetical protein
MPEDNAQVMLILQLEESLLQADIHNSEKEVSALLADEFIEFGSSGRVYDKQQAIESLQNEPKEAMPQRVIADFNVSVLAAGIILVTYRLLNISSDSSMDSLRSSIWELIGDRWQIVFHQGTPINLL